MYPVEVGLNTTVTVQDPPTAICDGQLVLRVNWLALFPASDVELKGSAMVPVFARVTD